MCPGCGKTEQRTAFNKQIKEKHEAQIAAILTPPPIAPSAAVDSQPTAQGFLGRMLAKICAALGKACSDRALPVRF